MPEQSRQRGMSIGLRVTFVTISLSLFSIKSSYVSTFVFSWSLLVERPTQAQAWGLAVFMIITSLVGCAVGLIATYLGVHVLFAILNYLFT